MNDALKALFAGPTRAETAKSFRTYVPPGSVVRSVAIAGDVATVDLGEGFLKGPATDTTLARLDQVVSTVTAVRGIRAVRLLIKGGTPLGLFPGVDATVPLTRAALATPNAPATTPVTSATGPTSPATLALQQQLAALGYLDPSGVDGVDGPATQTAVVAFQKWQRLPRTGIPDARTLSALATAQRPTPITKGPAGRRLEVLVDRQVLLAVRGQPGRPHDRRLHREAVDTDDPRLVQRLREVPEVVVGAVPRLAPLGVAVQRRLRGAPVPRRPHRGRIPRLRAGDAVRREVGLRLRLRGHADPRHGELDVKTRAVIVVVLALLVAAASAAADPPPTLQPGTLTVGLNMPSPGFEVGSVKGHSVLFARGFEIDLARLIAARLGIPRVVFYQEAQFPRLIAGGPKPWDIALAEVTITDERSMRLDFSVPYLAADEGVLLRRGLTPIPTTIAQLAGLRLCTQAATTSVDVIKTRVQPTTPPEAVRQRDAAAERAAGEPLRCGRLRRADPRDPARPGAPALRAVRRGDRHRRAVRRRDAAGEPARGRGEHRDQQPDRRVARSPSSRNAGSRPTSRRCRRSADATGRGAVGHDGYSPRKRARAFVASTRSTSSGESPLRCTRSISILAWWNGMSDPNRTRSGPTRSTASRILVGIGMPDVSR